MSRRLNVLAAVGGLGLLAAVGLYCVFRLESSLPGPAPPFLFPKWGDLGGSWQNPADGATYRWIPPGVFTLFAPRCRVQQLGN